MDFSFGPELEAFRQEVRELLDREWPPERQARAYRGAAEDYPWDKEFRRKLGERGWLGIYWPKEYGGGEKTVLHSYILAEELSTRDAPFPATGVGIAGPTILRYGTEEQKKEWLPRITSGEIDFALGYSEPGAGTDLASLEIRAVPDGDDFVINGTKIFNSGAHRCEYEWLAARTDPGAPKHRGISLFIVPIDSPGISIHPLWTVGDWRTNQTYFDNVRVPRHNLIGELNRGWYYVATALDYERVAVYPTGRVRNPFNALLEFVRSASYEGRRLADDPVVRSKIAQLSIDLEVGQLLSYRNVWLIGQGIVPNYEASMMKVFLSELNQRIGHWGTQILGLYGQLQEDSKWAPARGAVERHHRTAIVGTFGAGSNEIQRNIIAIRGLGLPRG